MKLIKQIKKIPIDSDDWGIGIIAIIAIGYLIFHPDELNIQFKLVLIALSVYFILSVIYKIYIRKKNIIDAYSHKMAKPHNYWPDLPSDGFISGKVANDKDVRVGDAVFALEGSVLINNIEIPQYGVYVDSDTGKEKTPLIIIQSERIEVQDFDGHNKDLHLLGFINLHYGFLDYDDLDNIKLLGVKKPDFWIHTEENNELYHKPIGYIQIIFYAILIFGLFFSSVFIIAKTFGPIKSKPIAMVICFSIFGAAWYVIDKCWPIIKRIVFLRKRV